MLDDYGTGGWNFYYLVTVGVCINSRQGGSTITAFFWMMLDYFATFFYWV
jgi:hypothetical protein